jgi:hypothetical protein
VLERDRRQLPDDERLGPVDPADPADPADPVDPVDPVEPVATGAAAEKATMDRPDGNTPPQPQGQVRLWD